MATGPVESGRYWTPQALASRRRLASALMAHGLQSTPIASPWQGVGRIVQAMVGGYGTYKADEQERKALADLGRTLAGTGEVPPFGPPTVTPAAAPAPSVAPAAAAPTARRVPTIAIGPATPTPAPQPAPAGTVHLGAPLGEDLSNDALGLPAPAPTPAPAPAPAPATPPVAPPVAAPVAAPAPAPAAAPAATPLPTMVAAPPPDTIRRLLRSGNPQAVQFGLQLYRDRARLQQAAALKAAGRAGGINVPQAIKTQAIKADQAYSNLTKALDDYARLVDKTGWSVLPGQEADAIAQSRRNIQLQLKELYNLGVLNGPDLALMESMVPDPSFGIGWTGPYGIENVPVWGDAPARVRAGVERLKEMLRGIRNTAVAPLGAPPVEPSTGGGSTRRRYNPNTGALE